MENVKTKARKAGGLACQEHILKVTAAEPDDFTSRDLHGGTRDSTPECPDHHTQLCFATSHLYTVNRRTINKQTNVIKRNTM